MPPFGLFKKKDSDNKSSLDEHQVQIPNSDMLSIEDAQDLLRRLESEKVQKLSARLLDIKGSVSDSMKVIDSLAADMDREKIKLEGLEQRLRSIVENSKRTVVASLRREASLDLPAPDSANGARKFKERFESMMKRFGEVSGSHSKMLNAFMKKHSNKMKGEFETLTKMLNETRAIISEFDQSRAPIMKCSNTLNILLQKISSMKLAEANVENMEKEIQKNQTELDQVHGVLAKLRSSPEFEQANIIAGDITRAENQQEELHIHIKDLFSRLSRAFTKYSYGLTKETERLLRTMSDEPWKIIHENDISPYSALLVEIRKSIRSGNIELKDPDKVLQYIDIALKSLPELSARAHALQRQIELLRDRDIAVVYKLKELEKDAEHYRDNVEVSRQRLEQHRRQAREKKDEVDALVAEAGKTLAELTGKKYLIQYQ
ncbi:MAG: hypothetical protein M3247_03435 [Thermoproteota archaeon]|nr:hypothetical protein [Thermoproteota archaeon]